MSNSKIIKRLKIKYSNLTKFEISRIYKTFLETINEAIVNHKTVEIRNFGRFYFKRLKENYNARNPATNELIYLPERVILRFKASKKLNKLINE